MQKLGIIGVGNTIAGDDGAGIAVVRKLRDSLPRNDRVFFHELAGDTLSIADHLGEAGYFIFCDAFAAENPGEIRILRDLPRRSLTPSFHQTDIASTLQTLKTLAVVSPFPGWELWGIAIEHPRFFSTSLSPEIVRAVDKCAFDLARRIAALGTGSTTTG
jgi:hydrogenase maturation protease